ncbi:MAG: hypothetical protein Q4B57_00690 [Eubacteriales bacterium]|nr:hypothetical protein [Eubacteriales bacterium]
MKKKWFGIVICIAVLIMCMPSAAIANNRTSILFIGNSLTFRSNFVGQFRSVCKSAGKKVWVDSYAVGGSYFSKYANRSTTVGRQAYQKIHSRKWNYVVLQENTDWITARPGRSKKAAKTLIRWIREKSPDAQIIYNASWAYKHGYRMFGEFYTFSKNQSLLNKNYRMLQEKFGGTVAYTGNAFRKYRKKYSTPALYVSDNNHPTTGGAYLAACTIYATMFGSTDGITYRGSCSAKTARHMRQIAESVCEQVP